MYIHDSVTVQKSILAECGLRIKKENVGEVVTQLIILAKEDLENELESNFTIKDLVDNDKTSFILDLYLKYFELDKSYGGFYIYRNSFLSSKNSLNKDYIIRNIERFKEMFSNYIESISAKDVSNIPEAYIYFMGIKSLERDENGYIKYRNLLNHSKAGPFKKYFIGIMLRENVLTRNVISLWDSVKDTNLVTDNHRLISYQKMIMSIRASYMDRSPIRRYEIQLSMYQECIELIKDTEMNIFNKNIAYVNNLIDTLPFE